MKFDLDTRKDIEEGHIYTFTGEINGKQIRAEVIMFRQDDGVFASAREYNGHFLFDNELNICDNNDKYYDADVSFSLQDMIDKAFEIYEDEMMEKIEEDMYGKEITEEREIKR